MTDDKGTFSFKTYRPEARLVISAVGYNEYTRLIHPARGERIKVALAPTTYALNEVVVKPKRERYKKKNNPAVEFVRKMIEHRDDYSPDERDFWQRERYEKMTFAINCFDSVKQQKLAVPQVQVPDRLCGYFRRDGKNRYWRCPTASCWLRIITVSRRTAR